MVKLNVGLVDRYCDWLSVVVWFSNDSINCVVSVVVDWFKRFDNDVVEATVDVGGWYVVVAGLGLGVVVVVTSGVDVCHGVDADVEEVTIFVVLTSGGIDVVSVFSTLVVVCNCDALQIYNEWSISLHVMLCEHRYKKCVSICQRSTQDILKVTKILYSLSLSIYMIHMYM